VWEAALTEAAFMTGLERNADIVRMASYAPLLAHVNAWQWAPNLIWFDNLRSYGTPSYYVQQVYGRNRGTRVLPITADGAAPTGTQGLYASAALDEKAGEIIVKLVNTTGSARPVRLTISGAASPSARAGRAIVMTADLTARNSFEEPTKVAPVEEAVTLSSSATGRELPPHSLTVLRLPR
jgi:alpha-N-arabinofuranosidase